MIVYALHCACGHDFDQWFDNMGRSKFFIDYQ